MKEPLLQSLHYADNVWLDAHKLLRELHNAGACDATEDWDKGYDCGIDTAIEIVEKMSGVSIEDVLEMEEI